YDANHVFLCDHCKFSDLVFGQLPFFGPPAAGLPPGSLPAIPAEIAQIVGAPDAAIDANATLPTRLENLFAVSRAQVVNALTQLTGEVHTGAEQASFQSTNSFMRFMLDPSAETRDTAGLGSAHGLCARALGRISAGCGARLRVGAQGAGRAARPCQPPLECLGLGVRRPRQHRRRSGEYRQP